MGHGGRTFKLKPISGITEKVVQIITVNKF